MSNQCAEIAAVEDLAGPVELGQPVELLTWRGGEPARITARVMDRYLRIRGPEELLRHEYVDVLLESSSGGLVRVPCRVVRARKHLRDYLLEIDQP